MPPETEEEDVIVIEDSDAPEVDNSETVVEAPEAVVEASPTIVVESDGGDDAPTEVLVDHAIDTAERLTALESMVGQLVNELSEVRAAAADAQFTAEVAGAEVEAVAEAVEPMAEAVAETVEEDLDLEPDVEPSTSGRHWFFKSYKEWKGEK